MKTYNEIRDAARRLSRLYASTVKSGDTASGSKLLVAISALGWAMNEDHEAVDAFALMLASAPDENTDTPTS